MASMLSEVLSPFVVLAALLGVVGWLSTMGVARASRRGAAVLASALLAIAVVLALTGLTVSDTSGELGLAPLLGWLQLLPCIAGLVAVALFWRKDALG